MIGTMLYPIPFIRLRSTFVSGVVVALGVSAACGNVTIDIDYSLDTNNFFNSSTANGIAARAALAAAADTYGDRLLDTLSAISPSGVNTWTPTLRHPVTGATANAPVTSIAANTVKLFAAGRAENAGTLAVGGYGGYSGGGTQAWLDTLKGRGQAGALPASPTDFARWGGSISFDNTTNWNYSVSSPPAFAQYDFYSVALHELGHFLGFGTAQSFTQTYSSGLTFIGAKSQALNGGSPVPLANTGHLSGSLFSPRFTGGTGQQPSMSPSIANGQRKLFTLLDWAGLDDLGWDLARPGDANANASVDFDDLLLLAQNYLNGSGKTWSEGDFDYDGSVTFDDLLILAQNYPSTGPLLTDVISAGGEGLAADWTLAKSLVPEPTSVVLFAVLGRRRRSN